MGTERGSAVKLLFWIAVGLWVVPQIEKQIYARLDEKRFG